MTQDGQVDVNIKLGADISGGVQSREELERIREKAKKVGDDANRSAKRASAGMSGFEKSVGRVKKALTGFGVAGMLTAIIAGVENIVGSFGRAEKKAKDLQKAAEEKGFAKSISDLADSYAKLNAQLAAAAQKENNVLEIIDLEVKARRELQEAQLSAAEENEIAGVDSNADDAEEQKKVIREKYAHIRSTRAASDKVEDLVLQRQKYDTQAKNDDKAAEAKDKEAEELERKARQAKGKAAAEQVASTEVTDKDKVGFGGYVGGQIKDLFTGNWGNLSSWKTEAGDAEREKHREKQENYEKQAEELQKKADAARKEAEANRESARQNRRRMEAMNGSVEAAKISAETSQVKSTTAESDAANALQKKRDDKAKENAKTEDAKKAAELLSKQKYDIKAKIAAEQEKKDAANKSVYDAQGNADAAKYGGSRKDQKAAGEALREAQNAAQNVNHAADTAINALTETLRSVEERLKAAQSYLEKQSKQNKNAWSETPAG